MPSRLINIASSLSKPSIRKHPSSENLFVDHHQYLRLQQQVKHILASSPLPPSPSKRVHATLLYSRACFLLLCVIITIAAFQHCSSIDPPQLVERSLSLACCGHHHRKLLEPISTPSAPEVLHAWKGLGRLFVRGSNSMSELVIAHVSEATQPEELRVFLRTTYRTGVFARADVVFLFPPNALSTSMVNVIYEEHYSFRKILFMASENLYDHNSDNSSGGTTFMFPPAGSMISSFNLAAYRRNDSENVSSSQPFWGSYSTDYFQLSKTQLAEAFRWGSVVGFDTSDLNAEDALQGFFDHPPVMLRRWPCYQMLLGMVRRRFKHVLLVDVGSVVFLGDPFSLTAKRKFGLYLSLEDRAWGASNASELGVNRSTSSADPTESRTEMRSRHSRVAVSSASKTSPKRATNPQLSAQQKALGKRRPRKGAVPGGLYERVYGKHSWSALEDFERRKRLVNSGVILGSIHQVRGLANAMATEIVRVALERANRDAFPDSVLLSYLLHKSPSVLGRRVLDHLHLLDNGDSFVHSLIGSQQHSSFRKQAGAAYAVIHGSSKNKRWRSVVQAIRTDICTSNADARAYTDCHDISKLL